MGHHVRAVLRGALEQKEESGKAKSGAQDEGQLAHIDPGASAIVNGLVAARQGDQHDRRERDHDAQDPGR